MVLPDKSPETISAALRIIYRHKKMVGVCVWMDVEYKDLVKWLADVHGAVPIRNQLWMRGRDWVYSKWDLGTIANALEFARAMNKLKRRQASCLHNNLRSYTIDGTAGAHGGATRVQSACKWRCRSGHCIADSGVAPQHHHICIMVLVFEGHQVPMGPEVQDKHKNLAEERADVLFLHCAASLFHSCENSMQGC